ncbi:MAG: DMT family transporter, partial [Acidimicrobiales bacterium]
MKRLALLAFIWGWSFLFIKVAVEGMTPPTVAAARVGLGALVLYGVLRARGGSLPRSPRLWRDATVAAVFGSVVPFTLLAWGEQRITSALTAVLNASTPLFTAVAAGLLLRDRLKPVQAIGLVVSMAGVGVAAGLGGEDLAHSSFWGSTAAVGAGACYGIAFAWMRRHLTGVAPLCASTVQLIAATVLLAPFALATSIGPGIQLTPPRLGAVLLLG